MEAYTDIALDSFTNVTNSLETFTDFVSVEKLKEFSQLNDIKPDSTVALASFIGMYLRCILLLFVWKEMMLFGSVWFCPIRQ